MWMQAIILMEDKALAMAVKEGTTDNAVHHSANMGSIGRGLSSQGVSCQSNATAKKETCSAIDIAIVGVGCV